MDFFEAQARAKQRTARLVVLFVFAVIGTILAAYLAGVLLLRWAGPADTGLSFNDSPVWDPDALAGWWHPRLFTGITGTTVIVVGLASLFKWLQYSSGGSVVAESLGGRRIEPGAVNPAERRLLNVVEEMAIASGTPVPAVYVLDDEPAINAFAAGLTTNDAVVAVTRGTLEKLNRDELQGVVGHEFSHILNGDMRLNMRLTALIFGILIIGVLGRTVLQGLRYVRPGRSKEKGGGAILIGAGLALMIVGYLGYFFGRLIQAAVSRQREFLADAAAVQFTRNPAGITGALKKIGGYALGGKMQSAHSAEIGHFFFAQAFGSFFGGLWATHPPLTERIRAIDASFAGEFFEPPERVDIGRESFVSAGLVPARPGPAAAPAVPPPLPPAAATAAVAAAGSLTPEQIAHAQILVEGIPAGLREAARQPENVAALLCGLLLADDPATRAGQRRLVAARAGAGTSPLAQLDALEPWLGRLPAAGRLPLVQLALPAVRRLPPAELAALFETLDELVHADGTVTVFEFALQKLLLRSLELGRNPAAAMVDFHSFAPLAGDLSVLLSALAQTATAAPAAAFAAGAGQLPLVAAQLAFSGTGDLAKLDTSLDRLARASPAIKQAALRAAAIVIGHDGHIAISEAELLRAVAAALDCPVPPLLAA
ncbi:MAG: hypothetical protein B9S34_12665 [Opitutia bacterium Tous-C1TDCM]|nr:MAG: hypothetical protein B9S34_12665 [Opitutae bacterium Tous-C1TDCM]